MTTGIDTTGDQETSDETRPFADGQQDPPDNPKLW